jgi:hypothetical protein
LNIFGEAKVLDHRPHLPKKRAVASHDEARRHGSAKLSECLER